MSIRVWVLAVAAALLAGAGATVPAHAAETATGATVASDDLGLLARTWSCRSYRDGRPTVAWVQRFAFTSGSGVARVGYQMQRGKPPARVTSTGPVAGRCAVAPTWRQLGLTG